MDNMNRVEEWVLQNKDKIEEGVEALATTVGQLDPILRFVFLFSAGHLNNPDGREAKYLAAQYEKLSEKLANIENEVDHIALEMQRTAMNKQNFDHEAQMISQYEKFQEFVNAKPKYKDRKKARFLTHFENTDGDQNLDALYNAVTGENSSGDAMLETLLAIEQKNRRAVEQFCARLKRLFILGLIAVMGYTALKEGIVEEDLMNKWQDRFEDVERRMKAAVDGCTENIDIQAQEDTEGHRQEKQGSID